MRAAAIILARAGSKGVPGKNIATVGGRACIEWTIDAALACPRVGLVCVTTDDASAAAITARMGAHAIDRPTELAGDKARVDDAARHAVRSLEHNGLLPADATQPVVILYANVPVRPVDLLDRALALLEASGCDSVQSYAPVSKHHPWWTARLDADACVKPWEGDVLNHGCFRRQDLPPAYIPDGGVIALTRCALMLEVPGVPEGPHAFFGNDRRGVISPGGSVVDIDAPIDLVVADVLLRARTEGA